MRKFSWILGLFVMGIAFGCSGGEDVAIPEENDDAMRELSDDEIEDEMGMEEVGGDGDDSDL
ncbi:MAG: hypothetical protein Fues2KO_03830 [Fuerstiella sp.]